MRKDDTHTRARAHTHTHAKQHTHTHTHIRTHTQVEPALEAAASFTYSSGPSTLPTDDWALTLVDCSTANCTFDGVVYD